MEILNSGSFIPLDNRERIEQLIFTARTLALEVSRNDGFQSSGQSNQQIGLELWNGAEYMTRSHEEVTVRNIFLSKFLERLREIERESSKRPAVADAPPMQSEEKFRDADTAISPVTRIEVETSELPAQQDEFLGVVDSEDPVEERPSYSNECIPECEDEIATIWSSVGKSNVVDLIDEPSEERVPPTPMEEQAEGADSVSQTAPEMKADDGETDVDPVAEADGAVQTFEEHSGLPEKVDLLIGERQIKSVVLSEKEPYNFDSCTVTAVIQLLPEANGVRDCILSIRSHDFAPQILFSNITGDNSRPHLSAQLLDALEQYRTALPGLAAEKMKKEKPPAKKRASKPTDKNSAAGETTTTEADAISNPSPVVQEQAKDQQNLFAS